eukprot:TRINITY_DN14140_c0_g1_i1.p1 TRINITY_DN14140_c0_g1~~TRINITY_DN14140_c0_g1_i1.p1  ORF type:complete len:316 (+),score=32.88 TRINITY_DN14140_c0_g1_i1:156-1103(+)
MAGCHIANWLLIGVGIIFSAIGVLQFIVFNLLSYYQIIFSIFLIICGAFIVLNETKPWVIVVNYCGFLRSWFGTGAFILFALLFIAWDNGIWGIIFASFTFAVAIGCFIMAFTGFPKPPPLCGDPYGPSGSSAMAPGSHTRCPDGVSRIIILVLAFWIVATGVLALIGNLIFSEPSSIGRGRPLSQDKHRSTNETVAEVAYGIQVVIYCVYQISLGTFLAVRFLCAPPFVTMNLGFFSHWLGLGFFFLLEVAVAAWWKWWACIIFAVYGVWCIINHCVNVCLMPPPICDAGGCLTASAPAGPPGGHVVLVEYRSK